MYNSIHPGKVWLDTNGNPIQAHGFSVFYDPKTEQYIWYGENKEKTDGKNGIWHWGVRCYRSHDLYNWDDCGLIIPPDEKDEASPLHPTRRMDVKRTVKIVFFIMTRLFFSCITNFLCCFYYIVFYL